MFKHVYVSYMILCMYTVLYCFDVNNNNIKCLRLRVSSTPECNLGCVSQKTTMVASSVVTNRVQWN